MTTPLDDKLTGWREATESLAPSEALQASLQAAVEAPSAPVPVLTPVKVLIITAVVGVVGFALLHVNQLGWSWSAKTAAGPVTNRSVLVTAGTVDAGRVPCGPKETLGVAVAVPAMMPQGNFAGSQRLRENELRRLLTTRPLTCLAQRHALEELLWAHPGNEPHASRLLTRLGFLCGAEAIAPTFTPVDVTDCDDSDWCHQPTCALTTEACALSWAAEPPSTCAHRIGARRAMNWACVRFLRGRGTEGEVRALEHDAWCLTPAALEESRLLRTRDAGMELP